MSTTLDRLRGSATVSSVSTEAHLRRRIAEMGIRVGSVVKVHSRASGGALLVAVGGVRIAVAPDIAAAIAVDGAGA